MSRDLVIRNPKLIIDLTGRRFGRLIVDQISIRRGRSTDPKPGSKRQGPGSRTDAYWLCVCDCGNVKRARGADLTRGSTRSCGCLHSETSRATGSRRGPDRWNWKGGLNSYGYSNTWIDGKNVLVHRVVMEQMLGRPLLPEETVHHKNGIRHDNRPENLELWTSRHPRGQRVEDKVAWAIDLLKLYAPERLSRS
jgi:hypothetical protein